MNQPQANTNNSAFEQLNSDQQHYVQLLANKKRLYAANTTLNEAVQLTLTSGNQEQAFKLAQKLSAVAQNVQNTAHSLAHQQKAIEQQHPEFKAQAKSFAQSRQRERQQTTGQTF